MWVSCSSSSSCCQRSRRDRRDRDVVIGCLWPWSRANLSSSCVAARQGDDACMIRNTRNRRPASITLLIAVMLSSWVLAERSGLRSASAAFTVLHKIQHVVMVMQENHSFDNYFGTFPGADGIAMSNGVPTGCLPSVAGGCSRPYVDHRDFVVGGPHSCSEHDERCRRREDDGFLTVSEKATQGCLGLELGLSYQPDERDRIPHRERHPELLEVRPQLRPPRPHVPAERVMEPARASLRGFGLVRELPESRSDELCQ